MVNAISAYDLDKIKFGTGQLVFTRAIGMEYAWINQTCVKGFNSCLAEKFVLVGRSCLSGWLVENNFFCNFIVIK